MKYPLPSQTFKTLQKIQDIGFDLDFNNIEKGHSRNFKIFGNYLKYKIEICRTVHAVQTYIINVKENEFLLFNSETSNLIFLQKKCKILKDILALMCNEEVIEIQYKRVCYQRFKFLKCKSQKCFMLRNRYDGLNFLKKCDSFEDAINEIKKEILIGRLNK